MQAVNYMGRRTLLQRWSQLPAAAALVSTPAQRSFAITHLDVQKEDSKLKKKLNMLKMLTED